MPHVRCKCRAWRLSVGAGIVLQGLPRVTLTRLGEAGVEQNWYALAAVGAGAPLLCSTGGLCSTCVAWLTFPPCNRECRGISRAAEGLTEQHIKLSRQIVWCTLCW